MVNPTMRPNQDTRLWFLSPDCLIEGFLDRIEQLRSVVLRDQADNPPYTADIGARLEQIGG